MAVVVRICSDCGAALSGLYENPLDGFDDPFRSVLRAVDGEIVVFCFQCDPDWKKNTFTEKAWLKSGSSVEQRRQFCWRKRYSNQMPAKYDGRKMYREPGPRDLRKLTVAV